MFPSFCGLSYFSPTLVGAITAHVPGLITFITKALGTHIYLALARNMPGLATFVAGNPTGVIFNLWLFGAVTSSVTLFPTVVAC